LARKNEAFENDFGTTIELQRFDDHVVASLRHAIGATIDSSAHAAGPFESGRAVGQ
jgi:hypothetical protein